MEFVNGLNVRGKEKRGTRSNGQVVKYKIEYGLGKEGE